MNAFEASRCSGIVRMEIGVACLGHVQVRTVNLRLRCVEGHSQNCVKVIVHFGDSPEFHPFHRGESRTITHCTSLEWVP